MISTGRWILAVALAVYGLIQLFAGIAFLTGAVKLPMDEMPVPPGQEQLFVSVAGGFTLLFGSLLLLAAWGVWSWRPWARVICVIVAVLMLSSIVVMAFQRTLPVSAYVVLAAAVAVLAWLFNSQVVDAFRARGQQA